MRTKNANFFGFIARIALVFSLASFAVNAADAKEDRLKRPDPVTPVNAAELKEMVKDFQEGKRDFLKQQQKEQQADARTIAREGLGSTAKSARNEAKEAIAQAKRVSREQARKLADEAKESAKAARKRE